MIGNRVAQHLTVDPKTLHLPPARASGADPVKLHRQIAKFGSSIAGMPPPLVYRGSDGELMIFDGVTRSTRVAKLLPGTLLRVEVIGELPFAFRKLPTVGGQLP
jgi:hypothetical protein